MIFAWVEGDTVFTESKFSGGKKAMNAQVLVFDKGGKQLLEGKTDKKGEFSFKVPKLTDLRLVLNAAMGHKAEWTIPESELRESCGDLGSKKADESLQPVAVGLSKEEIKGLIEESLDRKLRPIIKMMTESQSKGPSVTEIIGGIGYIFGLMGLVIYFRNRRKKMDSK
jgi:nickel transport protein